MVVQPSADARLGPARLRVEVEVAAGGRLDWAPQPTVVTRGAALVSTTTVRCAAGADLRWREVVALGRIGEGPGTAALSVRVDVEDRPLLRQTTTFGAGAPPGWDGPAGVGPARVVGSLLLLGRPAAGLVTGAADGPTPYAVMHLAPGAVLVTALGSTTLDVTRILDAVSEQLAQTAP